MVNVRKMKQDMRAEINEMKITNPALAEHYQRELFGKSEFDQIMNEKVDGDINKIVKFYPGGPKGPLPEDDPEHYSEWFMRNHPDEHVYGKGNIPDYHDLGVRWRYLQKQATQDDDEMVVEYKDEMQNQYEKDQLYPMQGYEGAAEWDIADRSKYDLKLPGQLPFLRFHSHLAEDELLPIPEEHTLVHENF